jgi:hypothetical protein
MIYSSYSISIPDLFHTKSISVVSIIPLFHIFRSIYREYCLVVNPHKNTNFFLSLWFGWNNWNNGINLPEHSEIYWNKSGLSPGINLFPMKTGV